MVRYCEEVLVKMSDCYVENWGSNLGTNENFLYNFFILLLLNMKFRQIRPISATVR